MFSVGDPGHITEHNKLAGGWESPLAHGGTGDGVADDTSAIRSAFAAALVTGRPVFFPAGTWTYTGGADMTLPADLHVFGAGMDKTVISLSPGVRLLTRSSFDAVYIHDLTVSGGEGLLKATGTGVYVGRPKRFERIAFVDYTGCAVGHLHSDGPFWQFLGCHFKAADFATSIGIALGGSADNCSVVDCIFDLNRVHIKAAKGGQNMHITRCGFIRWNTSRPSGPAVDVWFVPNPSSTNSGYGMTFTSSKLGNENLVSGDLRIVYADEDTGSGVDFCDRFPDLGTASTGYIQGHRFFGFGYWGGSDALGPIIFSTTPNVTDVVLSNYVEVGSAKTAEIAYLT